MRALGVDFGSVRIGFAAGDQETGVATALAPAAAPKSLRACAETIAGVARKESAEVVVLGLPLVDGTEGSRARITRELGALLQALGWQVDYVDESMTSVESGLALQRTGFKAAARAKRLDGAAAEAILERYFEGHVRA